MKFTVDENDMVLVPRKAFEQMINDMSCDELALSVRSAHCLKKANITTVGELAARTDEELMSIEHFGKKSLHEIRGLVPHDPKRRETFYYLWDVFPVELERKKP